MSIATKILKIPERKKFMERNNLCTGIMYIVSAQTRYHQGKNHKSFLLKAAIPSLLITANFSSRK